MNETRPVYERRLMDRMDDDAYGLNWFGAAHQRFAVDHPTHPFCSERTKHGLWNGVIAAGVALVLWVITALVLRVSGAGVVWWLPVLHIGGMGIVIGAGTWWLHVPGEC